MTTWKLACAAVASTVVAVIAITFLQCCHHRHGAHNAFFGNDGIGAVAIAFAFSEM